jgi:uncharacterized protein (TIGR03086 family)
MTMQSFARACASTRTILANLRPDQFGSPTPCASWDVGAVVNHVMGTPRWAIASVNGAGQPAWVLGAGHTANDVVAAYDETVQAALDAFGLPGALERSLVLPIGEFSGAQLLTLVASDQFTHGWDLARASGQSTDLDAELATELLSWAEAGISDEFRGPDGEALYGPAVAASPAACPADRLAAFLGRSV